MDTLILKPGLVAKIKAMIDAHKQHYGRPPVIVEVPVSYINGQKLFGVPVDFKSGNSFLTVDTEVALHHEIKGTLD